MIRGDRSDLGLVQICPNCNEENPDRFRLCGFCGTPLPGVLPVQEVRKTVTILFCDLKGSTPLGERLDSESLREVMTRYFDAMRAELERHGGQIEKYIGDAVLAVFGLPTVHEDDALRAVRAAAGMKSALARLNDELDRAYGVRLTNRTGVNTGEIVAGDQAAGRHLLVGDAFNTAARLEQAAPPDEVLIGEPTLRLVRHAVDVEELEPLELKGKAVPVAAYRLIGLRVTAGASRADLVPMVGRDAELGHLRAAFDAAVHGRKVGLVTVIGDAGVGKSRLIREFLTSIGDGPLVARGRCLPYGEGITFWPLLEIVREAAGIREDDPPAAASDRLRDLLGDDEAAARIASATGLTATPFPLPELFWGVRRFIEILAERRPVALVIDDVHWAEQTLLDLLRHLVESDLSAPAMLLCTARQSLLDGQPEWSEIAGATLLPLQPLGPADAARIVEGMLGDTDTPDGVAARVVRAADGNPLFIEQMVSMLIDEGTLRREGSRLVAARELSEIDVPPTIQALLAARLDTLRREERAVIEPASVIGQVFQSPAVAALAPESLRASVAAHLGSLERKQLVHSEASAGNLDGDYRFHHLLIRDAAYRGLLKRSRAKLHEQFVDWFEAAFRERGHGFEYEEILGYHLEQAYHYLTDLGPPDDHATSLAMRAAERLTAAGRRASDRGDMPAAANLLGRAAALLPRETRTRIVVLTEASEALAEAGELGPADEALVQAIAEAAAVGDPALETTARLVRLYQHYLTEGASESEIVDEVGSSIEVLERAGDHRGLTRAWRLLTNVHFAGCRYMAAEQAARRMIEHARLAGDRAMELRVLPALATCAQLGPTPVPEAIAIVERVLADLEGDRKAEAYTLRALANLQAMGGEFELARTLYRRSRATLEELGWKLNAALTAAIASGPVELLADDPVAAESELRRDYEALAAMGERNYISTTAAFLGEALFRQGRGEEANRFAGIGRDLAAADDVSTQVAWRGVRAKVLASRGQFDEGEALAREAVTIMETAEDPDGLGTAMLDLADVLRLAGRTAEAARTADEAAALFIGKGDTAAAARAGAFLASLPIRAPDSDRDIA